jgi:hypothetical protein
LRVRKIAAQQVPPAVRLYGAAFSNAWLKAGAPLALDACAKLADARSVTPVSPQRPRPDDDARNRRERGARTGKRLSRSIDAPIRINYAA